MRIFISFFLALGLSAHGEAALFDSQSVYGVTYAPPILLEPVFAPLAPWPEPIVIGSLVPIEAPLLITAPAVVISAPVDPVPAQPPAPRVGPPAPAAPVTQTCCLCLVDAINADSEAICNKHFTDSGCASAEHRQISVINKDSPPPKAAQAFLDWMGAAKAKTCANTHVLHADHSWSGYLAGLSEAGTIIQGGTGGNVTVKGIGCGTFGNASVTLTALKALCEKMPPNGPSLTLTFNQTIVTFADADQRPATFVLPRDCARISQVNAQEPIGVMNIASDLPDCETAKDKVCYTPSSNANLKPNTGNGGAISCRDGNQLRTLYCVFTQEGRKLPERNGRVIILNSTTGAWSLTPPSIVYCTAFTGLACYVEVEPLGNTCQPGSDPKVTGQLYCKGGVYCARVGNEETCKIYVPY